MNANTNGLIPERPRRFVVVNVEDVIAQTWQDMIPERPRRFVVVNGVSIPLPTIDDLKEDATFHDPAEIDEFARQGLLEVMNNDEDPEIRAEAKLLLIENGWLSATDSLDPISLPSFATFLVGTPTLAAAAATRKHTLLRDGDLTVSCEEDQEQTLTFTIRLLGQPGGTTVSLTIGSKPHVVPLRDDPLDKGSWGVLVIKADDWKKLPDGPTLSGTVVRTLPSGESRTYHLCPQAESGD